MAWKDISIKKLLYKFNDKKLKSQKLVHYICEHIIDFNIEVMLPFEIDRNHFLLINRYKK